MGRPPKKKKDKFDDLPESFKDAIQQSGADQIRKRIADIALLQVVEKELLKDDGEVSDAKDTLAGLLQPYRENLKSYRLQIEFCKQTLDDQSGDGATDRAVEQRSANRAAAVDSGGETNIA